MRTCAAERRSSREGAGALSELMHGSLGVLLTERQRQMPMRSRLRFERARPHLRSSKSTPLEHGQASALHSCLLSLKTVAWFRDFIRDRPGWMSFHPFAHHPLLFPSSSYSSLSRFVKRHHLIIMQLMLTSVSASLLQLEWSVDLGSGQSKAGLAEVTRFQSLRCRCPWLCCL